MRDEQAVTFQPLTRMYDHPTRAGYRVKITMLPRMILPPPSESPAALETPGATLLESGWHVHDQELPALIIVPDGWKLEVEGITGEICSGRWEPDGVFLPTSTLIVPALGVGFDAAAITILVEAMQRPRIAEPTARRKPGKQSSVQQHLERLAGAYWAYRRTGRSPQAIQHYHAAWGADCIKQHKANILLDERNQADVAEAKRLERNSKRRLEGTDYSWRKLRVAWEIFFTNWTARANDQ